MKKTPLRRVSIKRRSQLAEYTKLRREFLRQNPVCEVCAKRRTFEVHHKAGRSGRKLLDQLYWLAVCRTCHTMIHENPAWAREQGLKLF